MKKVKKKEKLYRILSAFDSVIYYVDCRLFGYMSDDNSLSFQDIFNEREVKDICKYRNDLCPIELKDYEYNMSKKTMKDMNIGQYEKDFLM